MRDDLYDYHDVDCEDCGHKFFVSGDHNFNLPNAKRCSTCIDVLAKFNAAWDSGEYDELRAQIAADSLIPL